MSSSTRARRRKVYYSTYLRPEQLHQLNRLAAAMRIPAAALVREALDDYFKARGALAARRREQATAGAAAIDAV